MGGCCGAMKTGQKSLPDKKKSPSADANQEKSNGKEPLLVAESVPATGTDKTPSPVQESTQQDGPTDAAVKPTLESVVAPEKVSPADATEPVKGKQEADPGTEHVMDLETAVAPYEGLISIDQPPKGKPDSTDPELLIPYQIPIQHTFSVPSATATSAAAVKFQEFQLRVDEPLLEANSQDYAVQLSIIENDPTLSVNEDELSSSPADDAETVPPATEPSAAEATPTKATQPRAFANVEPDDGANGDANIEELVTAPENDSFSFEAQGGLDEIVSSEDQRQGDLRQELSVGADVSSLPASSVSELDAVVTSEQGLESQPRPCLFDTHFTLVHPPEPSTGFSGSEHQLPDDLDLMDTAELTYNEHEAPVPGEESTSASFGGDQVAPVEFQLDKELLEEPATSVQTQKQELTPTDEHDLQQPNVADLETAPEAVNLVSAASEPDPLQYIQTEVSEETKQPDQPQADEQILADVPLEVPSKPALHHHETEPEFSAPVEETLSSDNLPTSVPQGEADESPVAAVPAQEVEFEPGTLSEDFQQETTEAESALESHPVVEAGTDLTMTSVLVDDNVKEKSGADDDGAVPSFHLDENLATVPDSLQTGHAEEFPSHLELTQAPQSEFEQQLSEPASHSEPPTDESVDGLPASVPEISGKIQTSETVEKLEEQLPHHEPSEDFVDEVQASVAQPTDGIESSDTVDTPEDLASYQEPETVDERQTSVRETSGEIQTSETVQELKEQVSHQEPSAAEFSDEFQESVPKTLDEIQPSETVEKFEDPVLHQEQSKTDFVDNAQAAVTEVPETVEELEKHHIPSKTELIDEVQSLVPEASGDTQSQEIIEKLEEQASLHEPPTTDFVDEVHKSVTEASDIEHLETVEKIEGPVSHQDSPTTDFIDEAPTIVTEASVITEHSDTVEKFEAPVLHHEPSTTESIDEVQSSVSETSGEIQPSETETVEKLEEQVSHHEPSNTEFIDEVHTSATEGSDVILQSDAVETFEEPISNYEPSTTVFDDGHSSVQEISGEIQASETVQTLEEQESHQAPSASATEFIDEVQSSVPETSNEIRPSETVEKFEDPVLHQEQSKTDFVDEAQAAVTEVANTVEELEEHHEPSTTEFVDEVPAAVTEASDVIEHSESVDKFEEPVSAHEPTTTEFIDEVQSSVPKTFDEIQNQETVEKHEEPVSHHEQSEIDFVDETPASLTEASDVTEHSETVENLEEPLSHHEPSTTEFIDETQASSVPEATDVIEQSETVEKLEETVSHNEPSPTEFIDEIQVSSVPEASDVIEQSETVEKLEETVSHNEPSPTEFIDEIQVSSVPEASDVIEQSETVEKLEEQTLQNEPAPTEFIDEIQVLSVPEASDVIDHPETAEKFEVPVSHHEPSTTEFIDETQASSVPETSHVIEQSETVEKLEEPVSHHEPSTAEFLDEIHVSVPEASGDIQTSETPETSTVLELISEQARESRETWWKEGGQLAADSELPVLELVTDQAQQSRQIWWEQSDPESAAENADSAALPLSSESVPPSIDQREEVPTESFSPHPDELSPIPPTDDDKAAVSLPIPTDDTVSPSPADDPFPEVIPDPLPSVFDNNRETVPEGRETPPDSAVESPLSADAGEGGGGGSAVPTESGDDAMTQSSDGAYASESPEDSTPSSAALTPGDVVDSPAEASKEQISAQA